MNRLVIVSAGLFVLLVLGGCVAPIGRPTDTPIVIAAIEATPPPTSPPTSPPTPEPPTPTPTPLPDPTATPAPIPTPIPTPVPTPVPPPLFLAILEPAYGITVPDRGLTVAGETNPGVTVTVGNRRAIVSNVGEFSVTVLLDEGVNVVEVIATDSFGDQLREFIAVTFVMPTPAPFVLLVTDPLGTLVVATEFIAVEGRTLPQATVLVNGVGLGVDEDGDFSTEVRLSRGVNTIEVVARNIDGQVLRVQRTVLYSP